MKVISDQSELPAELVASIRRDENRIDLKIDFGFGIAVPSDHSSDHVYATKHIARDSTIMKPYKRTRVYIYQKRIDILANPVVVAKI